MLLLRFLLAWLLFSFGPGASVSVWLTGHLDPLRRVVITLAIGSAVVPLLVIALGRANLMGAFPYICIFLTLVGATGWAVTRGEPHPHTSRKDAWACAGLVAIAITVGTIAFWHRLGSAGGGVQVYGLYDSMDLSYYAAIAAEASHTVPPLAPFYAGHELNGSMYPQLVLAMVHRFADVPLLLLYFRYAWPAFLALGAVSAFVLARELTSPGAACLGVALMLVGGDLSYLAASLLPHGSYEWDFLVWPTNFLSPTMEVLQFNTWTPTLPVFFAALYGTLTSVRLRSTGWVLLTAVILTSLFQFKPFAYAVVMAGLLPAAVLAGRDADGRRRLLAVFLVGALLTVPVAYAMARQPDRRSRLILNPLVLPQRMLIKLDVADWFTRAVAQVMPVTALRRPVLLAAATLLFLAGGLGARWLGLPALWRSLTRGTSGARDATAISAVAWCTAASLLLPFIVATDPYVETLQFYQAGLYLLWLFSAIGLTSFAHRHPRVGIAAIAMAIVLSLPSPIHFLRMKWTDDTREPRASLTRGELVIAHYLRTLPVDGTVVLHDRPQDPSLLAIVAERRVVLAWAHPYYTAGSAPTAREVGTFFDSTERDPDATFALLRKYRVTHVVIAHGDRVHPAVVARLRPVMQTPDATLYEVPAAL